MKGNGNRLMGLTRELRAAWEQTKDGWNDAQSRAFEKRFLDELFAGVNQAMADIEALERILAQIRSECE
jgi:hypothetical protein